MSHRVVITFGRLAAVLGAWTLVVSCSDPLPSDPRERAKALHARVPLIDGHNDLPWKHRSNAGGAFSKIDIAQKQSDFHTDLPRLRLGGVGAQFWSVYVALNHEDADFVRVTMEQIDLVHRMVERYPQTLQLALTADQIEEAFKAGKIASLIGMEGGHCIGNSLAALRMFYRLGARCLTLTHNANTPWADSGTDTVGVGGLSRFGEEVVREMNWLGMIVDLSHTSTETMHAAIDVSAAPVVFTHSSARALRDHPRNVPDDVLQRLPANGGLVMVTFVPAFLTSAMDKHAERRREEQRRLEGEGHQTEESVRKEMEAWDRSNPLPKARLTDVADHIDHIRGVAGIEHVGLGSDYDGIPHGPEGLEDVSTFPDLTAELLRRGYNDDDVAKVLGRNALRVMRRVEAVAARLQQERGPSENTLAALDGAD